MRFISLFSIILLATTQIASASPVRFGFQHPSFGGNPFNANFMLPMAEKQNAYKPQPQSRSSRQDLTREQQFKEELQRRVLSGAIDRIVRSLFGTDAQITEEIHYQLDDFEVTITPDENVGNFTVVINDGGSETVIVVGPDGIS